MLAPFDITADLDTPVSAYLKLKPLNPRFLLESVERGERLGRYSFIGFGSGMDYRLTWEDVNQGATHVLDRLRGFLEDAPTLEPLTEHLPFVGGLVGVASFDTVRAFEQLPAPKPLPFQPPAAVYYAPASLLVFDHLTRRAALLHHGTSEQRAALQQQVIELLRGPVTQSANSGSFTDPVGSMSQSEFISHVEQAKHHILYGDVYQLVLSICFTGNHNLEPFEAYRALRLLNPYPYMYFLEFPDVTVVGSSPEALVSVDQGRAKLNPIAGTRPRGETSLQDHQNETDLKADPKEMAEHVMLVDLARNDLGRVAEAGSIAVEPFASVERYSHVMHLVSAVTGQLRHDKDIFDAFAASFPAGTLVGAPKVRAMELIHEMEPQSRGLYAGTAGYFGHGGKMDQAIAIRTLVFQDGQYSFQAGAGIVADSDPRKEYEEVLAKSAILRRALAMAHEGL